MQVEKQNHTHEDATCCENCQPSDQSGQNNGEHVGFVGQYREPLVSSFFLLSGLLLEYGLQSTWFVDPVKLIWYIIAYLPVGVPVLKQAVSYLLKGDLFTEFFLMGIATIGAFLIGEYPEGVAVMLFYAIGEAFQHNAVTRARSNIRALLDVRPESAHVKRNGVLDTVHPNTVQPGEIIQVRPGERVPLDGLLIVDRASLDTSVLTGESTPRTFRKEESVLAGMINLNQVIEIEVTSAYENSSISRILDLVQNASLRKAKTELFIRSFARVYTPAVVFLAVMLVALPVFFVENYVFEEWLYRGLVFLVISCPCALVISIPLGYFGGIGAASRNGILVKGSNYLDTLRSVTTVVFDKTGTLTKGTFSVQEIQFINGAEKEIIPMLVAVEKNSTHPVAKAIVQHFENGTISTVSVEQQDEIPGYGVRATVEGAQVLIGSHDLMKREGIETNGYSTTNTASAVHVAIDGSYSGYVVIADEVKKESAEAIEKLRKLGVGQIIMLSGDRDDIAQKVGKELNIDRVYAGLLPEQKAEKLEEIKKREPGVVAYVGDGINDAPVLAFSDVGIAMGAMGSDAAIETADVVIQTDQPLRIATAIRIGRATRNIVWQNIGLAMGIKILVLGLGALGMATLWEAVFADVGVALLAILNAVRIQKMSFF